MDWLLRISVIIPVQAEPYACDGLNDLLHTIATAKKQINPNLKIVWNSNYNDRCKNKFIKTYRQ